MKSIDRLVAEHDIIERGLAVLEKAVARMQKGDSIPNDFVNWITNAVGDYQLAEILSETTHQTKFLTRLSDHLEMLHEAAKDY